MPETITGEALYALLLAANPELAYTWGDLFPGDRLPYLEVADSLNSMYLVPLRGELACTKTEFRTVQDACRQTFEKQNAAIRALQGLVMQWRQLLQEHDELSVMSLTEIEDWNKHWEILKRRSIELLGEEKG